MRRCRNGHPLTPSSHLEKSIASWRDCTTLLCLHQHACNQVAMQFWDKARDVNWTFTFTNGSSSASSRGTCTSSQELNHSALPPLRASECVQQRVGRPHTMHGRHISDDQKHSMTDSRGSLRAPQRSASPADPARSTSAGLQWHTSHQDTLIASNTYPAAALRSCSA